MFKLFVLIGALVGWLLIDTSFALGSGDQSKKITTKVMSANESCDIPKGEHASLLFMNSKGQFMGVDGGFYFPDDQLANLFRELGGKGKAGYLKIEIQNEEKTSFRTVVAGLEKLRAAFPADCEVVIFVLYATCRSEKK
jgi:hypothetical protein